MVGSELRHRSTDCHMASVTRDILRHGRPHTLRRRSSDVASTDAASAAARTSWMECSAPLADTKTQPGSDLHKRHAGGGHTSAELERRHTEPDTSGAESTSGSTMAAIKDTFGSSLSGASSSAASDIPLSAARLCNAIDASHAAQNCHRRGWQRPTQTHSVAR